MRSTFHNLETAKSGLFASQTAIQTTGHNIANANTKGYTRQAVDFVAQKPMEALGWQRSTSPGQLGTGVDYSSIRRLRDSYLDGQFRNQNQDYGDWTVRQDTFEKLEAIINEPSDYGIRTVIDNFWNSWQDLAGQPDNLTARSVVIERAMAMTDAFNDTASKLQDLKADLVESIKVKVGSDHGTSTENIGEVNTLLTQIAKLNEQIYQVEAQGDHANDLRDQRDLLTDKLSGLVDIQVKNESDNSGYTIKLPRNLSDTNDDLVLVKANQANQIYLNTSALDLTENPASIVGVFEDNSTSPATSSTIDLASIIQSGEVHGYLKSIEEVETMQKQLDELVNGLVTGNVTFPTGETFDGINGIHQTGFTLDGQTNLPFFGIDGSGTTLTASNITVNISDPKDIAASAINGMKGNNQVALWIADMRYTKISGIGSSDEYFRSMVGNLGVKSQEALRQYESQKVLVEQVDTRRQSVSGVSLDEEMADLIKYQHAYNASARMLTAVDEMLDKVINGMGVVGR